MDAIRGRWRWRSRLCAALSFAVPAWADPAPAVPVPEVVRACDDVGEYPPLVFRRRSQGRAGDDVIGYAVDLLSAALLGTGHRLSVQLLPWRRCLELSAAGQYDIVLSAAPTPEREAKFMALTPYYRLEAVYVFDRSRPPPARSIDDLAQSRLCGEFGYSYPHADRFRRVVDDGAKTFEGVLAMLKAGRCDVAITSRQLIEGRSLVENRDVLPPVEFGMLDLPDASATTVSMMVTRATPYHLALAELVDRRLGELDRTGEAGNLLWPYQAKAR
jgi:polar amino acid transport system substrate-binding protein